MIKRIRHRLFPASPYQWSSNKASIGKVPETEAYVIVLWKEQVPDLCELVNQLKHIVEIQHFEQCKLWLRDNSVKNFTLRDNGKRGVSERSKGKITALISVEGETVSKLESFLKQIKTDEFQTALYQVSKSIPLNSSMNVKKGEQSPGLVSLSFFKRKKGMTVQAFREYWYGAHTPFALDIHPLWHYERNAVEACLSPNMPEFDAIVPLHLKEDEDLRLGRFFGGAGQNPIFNALRIQSDVENFIDLKQIETVAMREFVIS